MARGAPKQVSPREDASLNRKAADPALLTGSPINIDFAAVVIDAGWPAHGLRLVFWTDRVDTAAFYA